MTQRERFRKFVTHQMPEDMPLWGDWIDPYKTWVSQGMPYMPDDYLKYGDRGINYYILDYFGLEGKYSAFWGSGRLPVNTGVAPGFPYEVIEKVDRYIVYRNSEGMVVRELINKDNTVISQQYIDHALHGSLDWKEFRDNHLVWDHPSRYPAEAKWKEIVDACRERDWVVTIDGGSFYGYLRNWMSVEGISTAFYDEPEWMHEAVDYLTEMFIHILSRAVKDVPDIDAALFWEDMCFKNGPLCSPAMFREFFLPGYKKVTKFLRDNGVFSFWVDCDGNIEQLIDLWLEGGVNGFYPLEVAAGMDAYKIKKKYGSKVLLWGGIDKLKLIAGKEAIDGELNRIKAAVDLGGYIPLCDHGVQDTVSFENFSYYNRMRQKMFNLKPLPSNNKRVF